MKRYKIIRTYNFYGRPVEGLATETGCAIVYGEDAAKAQVAKLHEMGFTDARYEELPQGEAWFDDENWIG